MKPVAYTRKGERTGELTHAMQVGYCQTLNALWTGGLSLPARDAQNDLLQEPHALVRLYDGERDAGLYRVAREEERELRGDAPLRRYTLEHVLAFLSDDRIHGALQAGGMGEDDLGESALTPDEADAPGEPEETEETEGTLAVTAGAGKAGMGDAQPVQAVHVKKAAAQGLAPAGTTRDVLTLLLAYQSEARWTLGKCDFEYTYAYSFENTDLLSALLTVPKCFPEAYRWTFDTSTLPWRLNLLREEENVSASVRFGKNELGIARGRDFSTLCTRLYCLGYGEGVNQVSIREAKGWPYSGRRSFLTSPNAAKYGVIAKHLIDPSIRDPQTLLARGQALLAQLEEPRVSYRIRAVDLFRKTGDAADAIGAGTRLAIFDEALGIDVTATVTRFEKPDVDGDPLAAQIGIDSRPQGAAGNLAALLRQGTSAQGATSLLPLCLHENCDATHPAKLRFFLPEACRAVNACLLTWRLTGFRAYARGAAGGGASTATTQAGGGQEEVTREIALQTLTPETDEGARPRTGAADGTGVTHTHGMNHYHRVTGSIVLPAQAAHSHRVSLPRHTHEMTFGIFTGQRADEVSVIVDGDAEGGALTPAECDSGACDVTRYLARTAEGRVRRGCWHEIAIRPKATPENPKGLCRVEMNLCLQVFLSEGLGTQRT